MKVLKLTAILFLIITAINCSSTKNSSSKKQDLVMSEKGFTKGVVIDKTGLDGCSFLIELNDSSIFHPINMDEEFRIEGITVFFKYKRSRKSTTCMNGQPVLVYEMIKK